MARIEQSVSIDCSPDDVFAAVTDLDGVPRWVVMVRSTYDAPRRPLEVGDTFRQQVVVAGMNLAMGWQVAAIDAPHRVVYQATSPLPRAMTMAVTIEGESGNGASRVTLAIEYQVPAGLLGPFIEVAKLEEGARGDIAQSLANLKRLLEGQETPLPHPSR